MGAANLSDMPKPARMRKSRYEHSSGSPGYVGRRAVKEGVGTWEALLAGFVTLSGAGIHNRVTGQQGIGGVHSSDEAE